MGKKAVKIIIPPKENPKSSPTIKNQQPKKPPSTPVKPKP